MAIGYNRILNDFEKFTDSNSKLSNYKYIKYNCLEPCSFVLYLVFDNDTIPKIYEYEDLCLMQDIIKSDYYLVYALNYLDHIIFEVIYD